MNPSNTDKVFDGSIPEMYDTLLVPLIFESYAKDLVNRLQARPITTILELAAGTGVLTRVLAAELPGEVSIVATDLNQAMINQAQKNGTARPVTWQVADAMQLPFKEASFDAVVCQFGAMFFPDKSKAFAEVRRVLKPGGLFLFSVWDRIEENEFADTIVTALAPVFPDDPPRFLARTPHGYYDHNLIKEDLKQAGFSYLPKIETVAARSKAENCHIPALAYCEGTPLKNEIESRSSNIQSAIEISEKAIEKKFGAKNVDGKIQAHIIWIEN